MRTQANLNSHKAIRVLDAAYRNNASVEEALQAIHREGYPHVTQEQVEQQFESWDADSVDAPRWK